MASIRKREKSNGTFVYDCSILVRKNGIIVHRESKTFLKQKFAKDWGMRREVELQEKSVYGLNDSIPIADLIGAYLKEYEPEGRTKNADLNRLRKLDIAKKNIFSLKAGDLIAFIKNRNKTVLPQTANNDLVWMKTVLNTMRVDMGLNYDLSMFDDARIVLRREGLIGKAERRERRPTPKEIWILSQYFGLHQSTPMLHIMFFAIYSCRRQSEITRLKWDDINHDNRTCLIRNLKHPTIKKLNKRFKLPRSAYKIIMRQPKQSEFIFPYNPKTLGHYFRKACNLNGIIDLRFHDLRHEGVSRLFEAGLSIAEVQKISLHSTWDSLSRYTNLDPGDVDV